MREKDIQAAIMEALGTSQGVKVFRLNVGFARSSKGHAVRFGVPGMADLLVLAGPRYAWLEVKTPRGRQTPEQRNFQAAIDSIGGVYAVVRSVDEAFAVVEALDV